jgi:hypothetical protein
MDRAVAKSDPVRVVPVGRIKRRCCSAGNTPKFRAPYRVTGEFGGNTLTAIALPATSGSGTPAISDWVTCAIPGFFNGRDPHTVTAYQSPNGAHDAIAVLANDGATQVAVVDLTQMLNTTIVPRTTTGHGCASGTLPATVVSIISVP